MRVENKERKIFPEREGVTQATLVFLIDASGEEEKVLLAMKKRGFGKGNWNGAGGKFDEKLDGSIRDTTIRETKEEIGVTLKNLNKSALLEFYFPPGMEDYDQDVHVFISTDWDGEMVETEEMRPEWFGTRDIPYSNMWSDDIYWLPKVLEGRKVSGKFRFDENFNVGPYLIDDYVEKG